jgi:hypothetical protein
MGGRYGKYGETKRLERLRRKIRDLACEQGRPRFLKDGTGKLRRSEKRRRAPSLRG